MVQWVKNPPAIQKTQVRSLDQEDPLEEGMATHSNILAWRIPRDRCSHRSLDVGLLLSAAAPDLGNSNAI